MSKITRNTLTFDEKTELIAFLDKERESLFPNKTDGAVAAFAQQHFSFAVTASHIRDYRAKRKIIKREPKPAPTPAPPPDDLATLTARVEKLEQFVRGRLQSID